jgi:5,10-methylene-tetrahydrofolate dehydrogenase/methenyl tetrahydrofolate cyclohydrolase
MKEFALSATKYGAATTAAQIVHDIDLHGRHAVVTGASSGIGTETARALASAGADVTRHPPPRRRLSNPALTYGTPTTVHQGGRPATSLSA